MRVDDNVDFIGQFLGDSGNGSNGNGNGSSVCDIQLSDGVTTEELKCSADNRPYSCQCIGNGQLVKTCTPTDGGCSIPDDCCGF